MRRKSLRYLGLFALLFTTLSTTTLSYTEVKGAVSAAPSRINMTIYNGNANSRGFNWVTNRSVTASAVIYTRKWGEGPGDWDAPIHAPGVKNEFYPGYVSWKAKIIDLIPDAYYYYRIVADDIMSPIYYFKVSSGQDEYNILHVTDTQNYVAEEYEWARKTMRIATDRFGLADNIIHTGDFVQTNKNPESNIIEWGYTLDIFKEFYTGTVLTPVAGNHDAAHNMFTSHFNVEIPPLAETNMGFYYSYDIDDIHVTVLNTNEGLSMSTPLAANQLAWLENDLASTNATWKIVATHKGPFTTGRHALEGDIVSLRNDLLPLFSEYHVDLVLQGHDHVYARTNPYHFDNTGFVPNLEAEIKTFKEGNHLYDYHVNPGTFYVIPNTVSGDSKNLSPITPNSELPSYFSLAHSPVNNKHLNIQPNLPMYGQIAIKNGKLMYKSYVIDFDGKDMLYDYFGIFKYTSKEASRKINNLPTTYSGSIKYELAEAVSYYNNLPANELAKVSDELKEKIANLSRFTSATAYDNSREVVYLISMLPRPVYTAKYEEKLNIIDEKYENLSNIEKTFVENYDLYTCYRSEFEWRKSAAEVDVLIVDAVTREDVINARAQYETLCEAAKAYVENYYILLRLEHTFNINGGSEDE